METPTNSTNSQSGALVQMQSLIQNSVLPVAATVSHNEILRNSRDKISRLGNRKCFFYLTMLNLAKFLRDDPPTGKEGEVDDVTAFTTVEAWKHSDFLCQNYILNGLSDALYEVYRMVISESFQVAAIIEKLPLTWNDFKNYLKHKRKEMPVGDLIVRLQTEEDNIGMKKRLNKAANGARANVVEVKKDFKKGKQP
ncbi:hypothetical protein J1N35_034947 [Gossypium stocksii]|uniref:Uncharacterized protein n=1 Tax=Gossypium stocksii TaxID=47602 RepID=A0A9D3UT10_9ROSI|nr:hypothetical protein J1N35_034947 [Gossypium stocksii]